MFIIRDKEINGHWDGSLISPPLAVPAASSQERKGNIEEKIARNKVIYYNENVCLAVSYTHLDVYKRQEDDREYEVFIDGIAVGGMTTNVSGKLVLSVELNEGVRTEIRIAGR